MLHPFRCQSTLGEMQKARAPQYAIGAIAQLGPLARAMGYLVWNLLLQSPSVADTSPQMEMSVNMCYGFLKGIADGVDDSSGKKAIRKSDAFKSLMAKFEEQATRGFSMHPKMDVLRTLLIDHFAQRLPDEANGEGGQPSESRAMVFVSFRECVEEIVELLNKESPIIRAKPFIGQGTDKQGKKGYAQKEQLEVRLSYISPLPDRSMALRARSSSSSRLANTMSLSRLQLARRVLISAKWILLFVTMRRRHPFAW